MPSTTIQQNWTAAPLCYKTKPTINHIEFKNSHQQWKKTTTNKQNKLQNEIIKITIMIVIIVFWNGFGPVQNIIKSIKSEKK